MIVILPSWREMACLGTTLPNPERRLVKSLQRSTALIIQNAHFETVQLFNKSNAAGSGSRVYSLKTLF